MKFKDKLQVAWVILIFLLIAVLLFSVISLGKNIKVMKKSPITYGIENSEISYCNCYDLAGNVYNFPEMELKEGVSSGSS